MNMSRDVNLFFEGLGFGEGPRWHEGRLWFSDFILNHVASVDLEKNFRVEVKLDDRPSGLGWLPDGRLLIVSMFNRQIMRQERDGQLVVHADISHVASFGANDMVVGPDGTAYIGNLGSDLMAGEPLTEAKLAIVRPDGSVSALEEGMFIPNGSVIPPAGDTLIVGESHSRRYRAFPIRSDGSLGESRVWADLGEYSPDGCSLDAEGGIWFADPGSKKVGRVLEGGKVTEVVDMPDTPYACALGGVNGTTLFVITCPSWPTSDLEPGSARIWTIEVDVPHAGLP